MHWIKRIEAIVEAIGEPLSMDEFAEGQVLAKTRGADGTLAVVPELVLVLLEELVRLRAERKVSCTCDEFSDDPCPEHRRENQLQDRALKAEAELVETKAEAMEFARECIEAQGRAIEGLKERNEQLARWRAELRKARETCCRGKLCSPDADVKLTRLEGSDR